MKAPGRNEPDGLAPLGSTADCPALTQLVRLLDEGEISPEEREPLAAHAASCPHCETELRLLREFRRAEATPAEREDVAWVESRLQDRFGWKTEPAPPVVEALRRWWRSLLQPSWQRNLALVAASVLVVVSVVLHFRYNREPVIREDLSGGIAVWRSGKLEVASPTAMQDQAPAAFEWLAVPGTARYRLRILEVDGTEFWSGETTATRQDLPEAVRKLLVPGKTLVWMVTAVDSQGRTLAESGAVRFQIRVPAGAARR